MRRGRSLVVAGCVVVATTTTGCSLSSQHANVANGKTLFVQRCGSCHTLARAGTQGTTGPNLDEAFAQSRRDGEKSSTFEGMVKDQILHPSRLGQTDPQTGKALPAMPGGIVKGQDAQDVAAYVGHAAGVPGKDTGALATAGLGGGGNNGKALFTSNGCNSCHTLADAGANGTTGPNLNALKSSAAKFGRPLHETPQQYVEQSIKDPNAFVVPGYQKGVMPSNFGTTLKPSQIAALAKYLLSVSH